jgi:sugar lactone lactonase YvrE
MWTTPGLPTPSTGNVVRYKTDEGTWSVVGTPLNAPNMITLGPDGNLYLSADSMCTSRRFPPVCLDGGTVRKMATPFNDIDQASGRKRWRPRH